MSTSSYDRRLANVETGLSPTQLVVRWLEEAHRFDDMTAYMRSLVDRPIGDFPMDRLSREAQESARIRYRGRSRAEVEKGVRRSLIETMFRGQLVLEINVRSQNLLDREGLIYLVLVGQVGLAIGAPDAPFEGTPLTRLVQMRDLLFGRVTELHAFEAARDRVEARYLDGAAADFPAARRAWERQRHETETAAVMAMRMAELDGAEPPAADDAATFEARVASLAADFVEPAKSKAYNELGDGRRAQAIAAAWLHAGALAGTTPEPTR
jgi:choline dehydrogenase-like flavoprotein